MGILRKFSRVRHFRPVLTSSLRCSYVIYDSFRWYFRGVKYRDYDRKVTHLQPQGTSVTTLKYRIFHKPRQNYHVFSKINPVSVTSLTSALSHHPSSLFLLTSYIRHLPSSIIHDNMSPRLSQFIIAWTLEAKATVTSHDNQRVRHAVLVAALKNQLRKVTVNVTTHHDTLRFGELENQFIHYYASSFSLQIYYFSINIVCKKRKCYISDKNFLPSNIFHQTSDIIHQPSDLSHLTSSIIPLTSSLLHLPSYFFHQPSSLSHQTSSLSPLPSSLLLRHYSRDSIICSNPTELPYIYSLYRVMLPYDAMKQKSFIA